MDGQVPPRISWPEFEVEVKYKAIVTTSKIEHHGEICACVVLAFIVFLASSIILRRTRPSGDWMRGGDDSGWCDPRHVASQLECPSLPSADFGYSS